MLLLMALCTLGSWFYFEQKKSLRTQAEIQLLSVSESKAKQIADWRSARLSDAFVISESPLISETIARWLKTPNQELTQHISARLRSIQKHYKYQDVILVDVKGNVKLHLDTGHSHVLAPEALFVLTQSFSSGKPLLTDLHFNTNHKMPHIDTIVPILSHTGRSRVPIAAILLHCDASQTLYPLIASWPVTAHSEETLLVRRDGGNALFLNDLRFQKDTALKLRIPLSRKEVPEVMAIQGKEGLVDGLDYRGVAVLSVLKHIPDSPWYLITKVDKQEALALWNGYSMFIIVLIASLAGIVFAGAGFALQSEGRKHFKSLYLAESKAAENYERYRVTLTSIGDAVIATDAAGRVRFLNPVAEALTGWTQEAAMGWPLESIFRIVNETTRLPVENPVQRVVSEDITLGLENHTVLISRDGSERPIADSAAPIHDARGNVTGAVLVFRDRTEERLKRDALKRSEMLLSKRLELIEFARDHSIEETLQKSLDIIGEQLESPIGFYHFVEADQNTLSLQAWSTKTLKEFCKAEGKGMHYSVDQAGVWVDCIHQRKPVIHNDYAALAHRKGLPPGHAPVMRELVVPVMRNGCIVAILGVGNKPTDYTETDAEMVGFFADVSWELVERKKAAELLIHSEEAHRTLITALPDIVMRFDSAGRHLFVSDNVADVVGISAKQFLGKTHRELGFPESSCDFWEASIRKVYESGHMLETEFSFDGKQGATIFNWRLTPEKDEQGQVQSVFSISRDITEHRKTEREYQTLFLEMMDGFALHEIICDEAGAPVDYRFLSVNPAFERLTGLKADEIQNRTVLEIMPKTEKHWIEKYGRVALSGESVQFENYSAELNKYFEVSAFQPDPNQFACIFRDITNIKNALHKREISAQILREVASSTDEKSLIKSILSTLQDNLRIQAVGLRLRQGEDFPYYYTSGFPGKFVKAENFLCARDANNEMLRDTNGSPYLECMCGNVICGRTHPDKPFFTRNGSFWSNCTSDLLASTTEQDRQARTRNRCNGEGYESVALIPLNLGGEILGLIQLNDKRKNMFSLDLIEWLEELCSSIAIGLNKIWSENKYHFLFSTVQDAIMICDSNNMEFVDVNPAAEKLYGYARHEFSMTNCKTLFNNNDSLYEILGMLEEKGQIETHLRYHKNKAGAVFPVELSGNAFSVGERQLVSLVIRDITERKKVEQELKESELKLRTIFTSSKTPIGVSLNGVHIMANPAYLALFGYAHFSEIESIPVPGLIAPDCREQISGFIRLRASGQEAPAAYITRGLRKNGEEFDLEVNVSKYEMNSQMYTLVHLADITEKNRLLKEKEKLQLQLLQTQKMEAVGQLAGGMAHDFNNMLGVIIGYTNMLLGDMSEKDRGFEDMKAVLDAANRARDLSMKLLTLARKDKLNVSPVPVQHVIDELHSILSRTMTGKIRIELVFQDTPLILIDKNQMHQALLNICINSRDAMPGGGLLTIQTRVMEISDNPVLMHGKYCEILISDTGVGIPESILNRVFEPFFTTKGIGKGTGLGLSSAHGIIINHNGSISASSENGQGSTFRILLPVFEGIAQAAQDCTQQSVIVGTETLLIVDDEPHVLRMTAKGLSKLGYNVLTAGSGAEAVNLYQIEKDRIHAVILDMMMPEMDGSDVFLKIRQENPEAIVIISSGFSINGKAEQLLAKGANGFIQKPFQIHEMAQLLKDALHERTQDK